MCEKKGPALLFGYLSFHGGYCASLQQPPSTPPRPRLVSPLAIGGFTQAKVS